MNPPFPPFSLFRSIWAGGKTPAPWSEGEDQGTDLQLEGWSSSRSEAFMMLKSQGTVKNVCHFTNPTPHHPPPPPHSCHTVHQTVRVVNYLKVSCFDETVSPDRMPKSHPRTGP